MAPPLAGTILVINDEPSIVRGLAQLLRRDGYTVATAAYGRQALAQLHAQPYDVIVSDLQMPDLDGRAFYTLLLQQYPALQQRVIFLTGHGDEADSQGCASPARSRCSGAPFTRCWRWPWRRRVRQPGVLPTPGVSSWPARARACARGVNAWWAPCRTYVPRVRNC